MLLALADSCNDDGEWSPGVARLADKCKVSERAAQYTLRRLEELGELEIHTGQGFATKNGRTNKYVMKRYQEVQPIAGVQSIAPVRVKSIAPQGVKPVAPESSVLPTSITPQEKESATHRSPSSSSKKTEGPEDNYFEAVCWMLGRNTKTMTKEGRMEVGRIVKKFKAENYTLDDLRTWWKNVWLKDWRSKRGAGKPTAKQLTDEFVVNSTKDISNVISDSREHDTTIVIDPQVWDTTGLDW